MARNYFQMQEDPVNSLLRGFQGGQGILSNINRNQLMQDEAARRQVLATIKLHDEMKGMTYGNLDFYNKNYRPAMVQMGFPEGLMPQYENVEELNKGLYRNEQIQAMIKQKLEGPKVVPERGSVYEGGQFKYPEVSPARREMSNVEREKIQSKFGVLAKKFGYDQALQMLRHQGQLDLVNARADKAPKEWKPDLVDLGDGGQGYVDPRSGKVTPISGTKAKAGQPAEMRAKALKATTDQGIMPGDDGFEEAYQKNMDILKGTSRPAPSEDDILKALNPGAAKGSGSLQFPRTLRNSSTGQTVTVNSQAEYDKLMGGK